MNMGNMIAIFKKQVKETWKNKTIFIQFIMFPILTVIMNHVIQIEGMPKNFFVNLFATMYICMTPLISITAIIAEVKEKNTLRVLMMSNVKPYEYLLGVGGYIWFVCMMGAAVFCIVGEYQSKETVIFLIIMTIGILASLLIGAAIGTCSKTQMMATSITVPVMMIFSFLPMLSLFNSTISKIARFIYSEQVSIMINQLENLHICFADILIIVINMLIAFSFFVIAYKKCGLS